MAAGGFDIRLLGDKALDRKFGRIARNFQKKVMLPPIKKAGVIFRDAARRKFKSNYKKQSPSRGTLKSIKSRPWKRSRVKIGRNIWTGSRDELGIAIDDKHYYPAALEYGKKGKRGKPFMRPAFSENEKKVFDMIKSGIGTGIDRLAR